ncbi:MAG: SDR family NAD(P)-dependent oxidoreductase, partial [Pseudolabrys sp.]
MSPGSDTRELAGYRALVTGGTQGIGAAVVARLREAGATVLTTARKQPAEFASDNLFVTADVATVEGCAAVAGAVIERLAWTDPSTFVRVVASLIPKELEATITPDLERMSDAQ